MEEHKLVEKLTQQVLTVDGQLMYDIIRYRYKNNNNILGIFKSLVEDLYTFIPHGVEKLQFPFGFDLDPKEELVELCENFLIKNGYKYDFVKNNIWCGFIIKNKFMFA